jgi:hypothetical protein
MMTSPLAILTMEIKAEQLFDHLPVYGTRETIADDLGWSVAELDAVLSYIRTNEYLGMTIPHVPRGGSEHLYQFTPADGTADLDEEELLAVEKGNRSTVTGVVTQLNNNSRALRHVARHLPARDATELRRWVRAMEGASAMAESIVERIDQRIAAYDGV